MSGPHFRKIVSRMVDDEAPVMRAFWRSRYGAATPAEAQDPRPFAVVLKEREAATPRREARS